MGLNRVSHRRVCGSHFGICRTERPYCLVVGVEQDAELTSEVGVHATTMPSSADVVKPFLSAR